MALKNNWKDLVDGESFVEVEPINRMAHAIIANEESILSVQKLSESIQAENKSQEAEINELSKDLTRFEGDAVRLDSKINENKKRITNLEKGISSDLFLTDSSIAYSKDVPIRAFKGSSLVGKLACFCFLVAFFIIFSAYPFFCI